MDQSIGWFQEEQEGQAKQTWSNIWETELEYQQALQQQAVANGQSELKSNESSGGGQQATMTTSGSVNNLNGNTTFNPTRRKATNDNKASTYNMNKYTTRLVGKHGGCPWRPPNFNYSRGILG